MRIQRQDGSTLSWKQRKCRITTAPREVEQEEKVNEQRAFPNMWLSAGCFFLTVSFSFSIMNKRKPNVY